MRLNFLLAGKSQGQKIPGYLEFNRIKKIWDAFYEPLPKEFKTIIKNKSAKKNQQWQDFVELLGLTDVFKTAHIPEQILEYPQQRQKVEAMLISALTKDQILDICNTGMALNVSELELDIFKSLFFQWDWMSTADRVIYLQRLREASAKMKRDAIEKSAEDFCRLHSIPISEKYIEILKDAIDQIQSRVRLRNVNGETPEAMRENRDDLNLMLKAVAQLDKMGVAKPVSKQVFKGVKAVPTTRVKLDDEVSKFIPSISEVIDGNTRNTG